MAVYKFLDIPSAASFENFILSSNIISVTNENKLHPAKNLLDPIKSNTYRTTSVFNERNGYFQIVFDLGSARLPTVLAIVNSNITKITGSGAYLIGATNQALTTSTIVYDAFPLYQTHTGVLRWYLDTPSTNPPGVAKRYWGFRMYPNDWGNSFTGDSYFEFGNIWLGDYVEIKHNYGSSISQSDTSMKSLSFGGATYVDENRLGHKVSLSMSLVPRLVRNDVVAGFKTYRKSSHILLDFEPYVNDVTSLVGGHNAYYGKLGNSIKSSIQFSGHADMFVTFNEALA